MATAGRWCPQPVNRHLAGKVGGAGPPGSSEAMSEMEKKEQNPQTPDHLHHPEKRRERGHVDVRARDLPLHTDWRVEVVHVGLFV